MNTILEKRLKWLGSLTPQAIRFIRGIEKEGLRVTPDSRLAQTSHPVGLGSALTHPSITTDYSEALLEFITPTFNSTEENLDYLENLHRYAYLKMPANELIWPGSMPAIIDNEQDVRIAEYGSSNIGRLKHVYRHGLWHRYGRIMQAIAGLHFNFSMTDEFWQHFQQHQQNNQSIEDFKSDRYFSLIRHFRRHSWLLMILFGASPAIDQSFLKSATNRLSHLHRRTLISPTATSLRMSDIGYTNSAQANLHVCFNGLPTYIQTLRSAIHTEYPAYASMGIKKGDDYLQMNTNILQIENEYYSDIRPKRTVQSGEKPVCALQRRGVEYIEVRCMDLDPFNPIGISAQSIAFLELFLTWCMLSDSEFISDEECELLKQNLAGIVMNGSQLDQDYPTMTGSFKLRQQATTILDELKQLAEVMDHINGDSKYRTVITEAQEKIDHPELLPSSRIRALLEDGQEYHELMHNLAQQHRETLMQTPLSEQQIQSMETITAESLQHQREIESNDDISFEQFLAEYQDQDARFCHD
ncbi:glutamate--cysteine ligase [Gynuella sp.]|uniref:glutamate--cysteine ligase n=1 Tax=Gynuella sp. TaxID=2969146 RepID=UPI003D1455C7